jgi:alpha-amylase
MPGVLEDLNSQYGTAEELRQCIKTLHSKRINVLADVVINHRCAGEQVWPPQFPWAYVRC